MRSPRRRSDAYRTARFETFEPRVVLSANPTTELAADQMVQASFSSVFGPSNADAHELTGLTEALRSYDFTGAGQTVVVIDSGVAYDHTALGGGLGEGFTVVGGRDFTEENDADPYDDGPFGSHGTHVAGMIASSDANNPGVAPEADIVALRVFNDGGQTQLAWVEEALRWVHVHRDSFANPITTVNLSMGLFTNTASPPDGAVLEDELAQLAADGIFVTAAAGNGFTRFEEPGLSYPASSPHVTAVGSIDASGELSYFTQRDASMLLAPGRSVSSTVPDYVGNRNGIDDDFAQYSGTSMASPYVAGAAVLVREAYTSIGRTDVSADTIYETLYNSADPVFDSATGASYRRLNIDSALDAVLAEARSEPDSPALPEAEVVEQIELGDQTVSASGRTYGFTAAHSGIFTVEAFFQHDRGDVDLELSAPDGRILATSDSFTNDERIDVTLSAGETVYLRASTSDGLTNEDVDLRVTNLVAREGDMFLVRGTNNDDRFRFVSDSVFLVTINGVDYETGGSAARVRFDGGAGSDTAILYGNSDSDSAVLRVGSADLTGRGYAASVANTESIEVVGRGGADSVSINDSAGDDRFTASAGHAAMTGEGFSLVARQFEVVHAYARYGGEDEASLNDTADDDFFVATPLYGRMIGDGYMLRAKLFESLHAYARNGGTNRARIVGSSSADFVVSTPLYTRLVAGDISVRTKFFDEVDVFARGGYDLAYLRDSAGDDSFIARPDHATLAGPGYATTLRNFTRVVATASAGGDDAAVFFDSAGADAFFADSVETRMSGPSYDNRARHFEKVTARASDGYDQATLFDSVLNDHLSASADLAHLRNSALATWVYDFDRVRAVSDSTGRDTAEVDAVDYILQVSGPWQRE